MKLVGKMSFEDTGTAASGAMACRYGHSKLPVRGPQREIGGHYVACLGSSETYGRFVTRPFADLLEEALERPCINLGSINAGLDSFATDADLLGIAAGADVTVLQLPGAQDLSNRFYRVHPRRNDRFLEATPLLKTVYRDIDFTEFHFNRHLMAALERVSSERFEAVREELQRLWLSRMELLIETLEGRVILLWLRYTDNGVGDFGSGPYLVTSDMVHELESKVQAVVQVPVHVAGGSGELDTMDYGPLQAPAAAHSIGPESHARIARHLGREIGSGARGTVGTGK